MKDNMASYKRLTITLHPIEIEKLKRITEDNQETISGMISRLIQGYLEKEPLLPPNRKKEQD